VWSKRWSYLFASLAPLLLVAIPAVLLWIFGLVNLVPMAAELWAVLFPLAIIGGLTMALALVGLIGWPMVHATLSAEGSDSFDALSRSYSYVYQAPWQYAWYSLIALVYGAVVVFFVTFMGSLAVYLGKWGMSQTPGTQYFNRDPSYMFLWAPTSYHWHDMLTMTPSGRLLDQVGYPRADLNLRWWNYIGIVVMSVYTYVIFLLVIGFSYCYFWSASTVIYLLMRRKVDDTELDEIYLEEEEPEDTYTTAATTAAQPS